MKGKKITNFKAPNLSDIRLNKSGTVGTEPIMKKGKLRTEVKLGKLGSVRLPSVRAGLKKVGRKIGRKIKK